MAKLVGGYSNTPPSPRFEIYNNICMDYLTVTWTYCDRDDYDNSNVFNQLIKILNINFSEVSKKERGLNGYLTRFNLGQYITYQKDLRCDPALGIFSEMIEIKGSGCRDLERRKVDIIELANFIKKSKGNITRFDIAYDDFYCNYCDIDLIEEYVKGNHYVSCTRTVNCIWNKQDGMYNGHTITFGATKSNKQLQIYDKKLERENNFKYDVEFVDKWIRYEMRFKKGCGEEFYNYIECLKETDDLIRQEKIIDFYFRRLYEMLDIKIKSIAKNKSDLPTVDWWLKFIGERDKIKIRNQHKFESSIQIKKDWVKRSVIKPLAKLNQAIGSDMFTELQKKVKEKEIELTPQDFQEIENYKRLLKETGEVEDWFN